MRKLYHQVLCPFSRKVRVALKEKKLEFNLQLEKPWEGREDFLAINPAGQVPVLEDLHAMVISDSSVICEYLDEAYPDRPLIGPELYQRAEARRLQVWFDEKFHKEVTEKLVFEKSLKKVKGLGWPDSQVIRQGNKNLHLHLEYIGWLLKRRHWLAGDHFTIADIAAGAHLSCLDFINAMDWDRHEIVKEWYIRLKSRPSFHPLLHDRSGGIVPPAHYANLDF